MLLDAPARRALVRGFSIGVLGGLVATAVATPARGSFVTFESGQVRPLALSPDGSRLFAVNTPDNRLEIFTVDASGLTHAGSVPVGLEPVAVAARDGQRGVGRQPPVGQRQHRRRQRDAAARRPHAAGRRRAARHRLRRPRRQRAPSSPRRGAGRTSPPRCRRCSPRRARRARWSGCSTPPISATTLTGTPLTIVELFGDTPRALAATPDGSTRLRGGLPLRQPDDDGVRRRRLQRHQPQQRHRRRARARSSASRMPGGLPQSGDRARTASTASRDRPDRQVQSGQRPLGGRAGAQLEQRGALQPARPGRLRHRRQRQPAGAGRRSERRLRRRRHRALQHGGEPGRAEPRLRHQHRGAQRGALRGPRHPRRQHRARPPARGAHHRARRHRRRCRAI